jgi:hypothetical protein
MDIPYPQQVRAVLMMGDSMDARKKERVGDARRPSPHSQRVHLDRRPPGFVERQRTREELWIGDIPVEIDPRNEGSALAVHIVPLRARKLGIRFMRSLVTALDERLFGSHQRVPSDEYIDVVGGSEVRPGVHGVSEPGPLE